MKSICIIAILFLLVGSCAEKKSHPLDQHQDMETKRDTEPPFSSISLDGIYFKANGNEPFWSLEMSDQMVRFKKHRQTHFLLRRLLPSAQTAAWFNISWKQKNQSYTLIYCGRNVSILCLVIHFPS